MGGREGREAFGRGGEPRGPGSPLVATETAPPAGCPGQCKMTQALALAYFWRGMHSPGGFTSKSRRINWKSV